MKFEKHFTTFLGGLPQLESFRLIIINAKIIKIPGDCFNFQSLKVSFLNKYFKYQLCLCYLLFILLVASATLLRRDLPYI